VVLIGHCGFDSVGLKNAVLRVWPDAQVIGARHDAELNNAIEQGAELLLINRTIGGFSAADGIEMIRQVKQTHPQTRCMLISNYDDAQQAAVAAGAVRGFGKNDLGSRMVDDLLRSALTSESPVNRT
jgi:DNA-binding NarL/FixJ family response regulator